MIIRALIKFKGLLTKLLKKNRYNHNILIDGLNLVFLTIVLCNFRALYYRADFQKPFPEA